MSELIALIAAMRQESDALLHRVKQQKQVRIGSLRGNLFLILKHSCVLVTSGMGVRRAQQATQILVQEYSPRLLISFGIAGAVEDDLEIGDVVLPEAYCRLEHGAPGDLTSLTPWPAAAWEAVIQVLSGHERHAYPGTAITTGGSQVTQGQLGDMTHPVLEMETAGIAEIALERGIPLLSLRAISDGPRAPLPLDLGDVMDENANLKLGKMLNAILRNPLIVVQSSRMFHNTAVACESAALALMAAINSGATQEIISPASSSTSS